MQHRTLLLALAACVPIGSLYAQQSGDLDSTFNNVGYAITNVAPDRYEYIQDIAVQADGRIVAVGFANTPTKVIIVLRYLPDGSLDTDFGTGGVVLTSIGGLGDAAHRVVIQADGRIVVAGSSLTANDGELLAVLRY
ncbi:MAG: hypothetical protein KDC00_12610, partial [Flavobacteriales bacterium]|nr:hypothetical protein [Flavobacteriales bacterium]